MASVRQQPPRLVHTPFLSFAVRPAPEPLGTSLRTPTSCLAFTQLTYSTGSKQVRTGLDRFVNDLNRLLGARPDPPVNRGANWKLFVLGRQVAKGQFAIPARVGMGQGASRLPKVVDISLTTRNKQPPVATRGLPVPADLSAKHFHGFGTCLTYWKWLLQKAISCLLVS